jgi:hypothetical protein
MQRHQRDYRLATVMFGAQGEHHSPLATLEEAVQFGLFSVSSKHGRFRRFIRSRLGIRDNGTIGTPVGSRGRVDRWDPDLTERPVGPNRHKASLFLDPRWERETRALKHMEDHRISTTPYTGIFPVYIDNTNLPSLDRVEVLRSVVHGINGTIPFVFDLSAYPKMEKALADTPKPIMDVGTQFECVVQNDDAVESLMNQLVYQHSIKWEDTFLLIPAQWIEKPIAVDTLVMVEVNKPVCFPAASPRHLHISKGALDLHFGDPPKKQQSAKRGNARASGKN